MKNDRQLAIVGRDTGTTNVILFVTEEGKLVDLLKIRDMDKTIPLTPVAGREISAHENEEKKGTLKHIGSVLKKKVMSLFEEYVEIEIP